MRDYHLLSVAPFEQLAAAIDELCVECAQEALDEIEFALRNEYPGSSFSAPQVDQELLELLKPWLRGHHTREDGRMSASSHSIWLHKHYRLAPTLILKDHLYPQSIRSVESFADLHRQITYGFGSVPNRQHQFYLGFMIPRIDWGVDIPGLVEIHAGVAFSRFAGDRDLGATVAVQYDSQYRERFGWYARAAHTWNQRRTSEGAFTAPLTISGGFSILLFSDDGIRDSRAAQIAGGLPGNIVRVRVGPRFELTKDGLVNFGRGSVEAFLTLRQ